MQTIYVPYMNPAFLTILRNSYYSTANAKCIVQWIYVTFKRYPALHSLYPALLWNHTLPMNAFLLGAMAVSISPIIYILLIWQLQRREDTALESTEQGFVRGTSGARLFLTTGSTCGTRLVVICSLSSHDLRNPLTCECIRLYHFRTILIILM